MLNAGYLDQQEKTDRRIQRALTEDSSDTGNPCTLYKYKTLATGLTTKYTAVYLSKLLLLEFNRTI